MKVRYAGILVLLAFVASSAWAKDKGTAAKLPKNPKALLQMAWQANGLHGTDMKPWHVLATWQELDAQGKPEKQGTFEEWWAGPNKVRMEMNGPAVHQTQWYTANGDFSTGDSWWPAWEYKLVADAISGSLPDAQQVEKNFPERFTEKIGSLRLHCAKLSGTRYCFSGIPPVLRIEVTPATEAISDGLVRFQGRYVAQDIRVLRMGMPNLEIHLEKIELLDGIKAADFTHAPGARMISARSPRIGKLTPGRKISGEGPKYPADAKSRHIEGTVMLWATIGTDGSLHHVEVIGGPAVLQQSAVDAVSTWHYEPYLYNGQPVPMSTEIDVVYSIGS